MMHKKKDAIAIHYNFTAEKKRQHECTKVQSVLWKTAGGRVKDKRIIAICHCSKVHENNGTMKFVA